MTVFMLTGCGNKENVQQVAETVEEEITQETVVRETEQVNETQEFEQKKSEAIEEYMNSLTNITLAVDCSKSYDATELGVQIELVSERTDVVEVSGTDITAKAPGLVEITCTVEGQTKSFEVVVTQPEINKTDIVKTVGQSEQILFYGTEGKPKFKSENPAIASVSEDGMVTAEPTGIGQSTNILAEVDGKKFTCKVTVEAIPQLQSMYKIVMGGNAHVGYTEDNMSKYVSWNADVSNVSVEFATYKDTENCIQNHTEVFYIPRIASVSSFSEAEIEDLDDMVFPVYRAFWGNTESIQIILAGTSQNADVWVKEIERLDENGEPVWRDARCMAKYTPYDGYGIIELTDFQCKQYNTIHPTYDAFDTYFYVGVEIGDYQTRLCIAPTGPQIDFSMDEENGVHDVKVFGVFGGRNEYASVVSFNVYDEYMEKVPVASDVEQRQAALESQNANSSLGNISSDFLGAVGEEMQKQAIEKIASIALKAVFGF